MGRNTVVVLKVNKYSDHIAFETYSNSDMFYPTTDEAYHLHYKHAGSPNFFGKDARKMKLSFTGTLGEFSDSIPSHCTLSCECGLRIVLLTRPFSAWQLEQYFIQFISSHSSAQEELHATTL